MSITNPLRVTIWNEYRREKKDPNVAAPLRAVAGLEIRTTTLDEPEHGLTETILGTTDKERLWSVCPSHPIAAGLGEHFELPAEEMYGRR